MSQRDVLDFWFRELTPADWFEAGAGLDPVIRERFAALHEAACRGDLADWAGTSRGRLALIILLDQFSRHLHRGTPKAFAADAVAQRLALEGIEAGMDAQLGMSQRHFFYMPLMHAEDPALQARSVERFTALRDMAENILDFARVHAEEIARFGCFPYRNEALGRRSGPEELAYLAEIGGGPQSGKVDDPEHGA